MIRKGPIDNIIETLDEKGGEIVINGQNGHLWLFDHQNISKGIPENSYENVLGHCNMLIANFTAKKFFLCFPVETLKTKILCQVTFMGSTFSPKLVSFSGALDKNKQTNKQNSELSEPLLLELLRLLLLLQLLLSHAGSPDGWSSKFICLTK